MEKHDDQEAAPRTISVKLNIDELTDTMIVDKEKGINVLLVAIPLTVPKLTALGFLWCVIDNMTTFYKHAEAQFEASKKGGIIKAGMSDLKAMGKSLLRK